MTDQCMCAGAPSIDATCSAARMLAAAAKERMQSAGVARAEPPLRLALVDRHAHEPRQPVDGDEPAQLCEQAERAQRSAAQPVWTGPFGLARFCSR